ncbi:sporulation-specific protein 15 isoform X1 [Leguminivora glycinivorella]|uniref:sporulation-specific protein 15 isoform X1 n=1 Tax=Leguminivora glycinivorella TaxID=1035111 RepID=UPI00200E8A67|nr:sporulation-specific protein 15 isoform X1 [Leguminivora glycinivorella]
MHHLYVQKGDPLCPLGFHPQVRWPTRCKRCFRDYKEHGGGNGRGSTNRAEDFTASTPSLSSWSSPASRGRDEENGADRERSGRGWASTTNLSSEPPKKDAFSTGFGKPKSSWTSTPDLAAEETSNAVTVSLKLPKRRLTGPLPALDTGQSAATTDTVTLRRPSPSPPPVPASASLTINKNDSLAERVRKMNLLKAQNSFEKESSLEKEKEKTRRSLSRSKEEEKPSRIKETPPRSSNKDDVNFMMQVKESRNSLKTSKPPIRGGPSREKEESDDDASTAGTTTTEGTLVDANVKDYQDQIEGLKQEVDILRKRCERVEKEKSDILLRRLANIDTANKYTTGRSSEVLKLQQKVNELTSQNEDLKDEKKHLNLKIKEIESELESRPSGESLARQVEQLRAKLLAAETLCEELMDENEDMKKELRDLEEEIEEMQDNFREDQADEYSSLRRELEQTIKNCRVLSFKLKKTERKAEQLEQEKLDQEKKLLEIVGGQGGLDRVHRIKELEVELARSNEVALRLQRELADAKASLAGAPPANLKKATMPVEGQKVSRAMMTRGGSQEDPAQLLRDLQDSLEREADLREQLKNAEEEADRYRQRFGGRRIPPPPKVIIQSSHPDLIPSNTSTKESLDENTSQRLRILEMQLALNKSISALDVNHLSIGVNQTTQAPQDHLQCFSQGCQTDLIMVHDVATETRVITLDSSTQCGIETLDTAAQTEAPFMKNKCIQTDGFRENGTQTIKQKVRNASVQTPNKIISDKGQQVTSFLLNCVDASTQFEPIMVFNEGTMTDNLEVYDPVVPVVKLNENDSNDGSSVVKNRSKEKSDSPPLEPDKTPSETSTSPLSFPFVSMFNPLAVRLPTIAGRKLSPTPPPNRLSIEAPNEKDEGISDEEDPAELRILLELNEQEAAVLRRKVEELEQDRDSLKKQVKELTEKVAAAATKTTNNTNSSFGLRRNAPKGNNLAEEKVKVLEDEIAELRKKLIEKERDCERLHAEISLMQKKPKASLMKSKSLDLGNNDQQTVDLKRQLQVIEQEATVLRSKTQSLEADNEKLQAENKKLQLFKNTRTLRSEKSSEQSAAKVCKLENELKEALTKIKELENNKDTDDKTEKKVRFGGEITKKDSDALKVKQEELDKLKLNYNKLEKENAKLQASLKALKEDAIKSFKPRTPKKLTDLTTKLQMKKMVEELESEIGELYVVMKNAGLSESTINAKTQLEKDIEEAKSRLNKNESDFTNEKNRLQTEIANMMDLNKKLEAEKSSLTEKCKTIEQTKNKATNELKALKEEKKELETKISKLTDDLKNSSTQQIAMADCRKKIEDLKKEMDSKDKEIDKLKKQVENISKLEQDKDKLLKEVGDKTKKINEYEKKLKEAEEKYKRAEKMLASRKDRVSKLEKEEEALRETSNQKYDEAVTAVEIAHLQEKVENTAKDLQQKEDELNKTKRDLNKAENELSSLQIEMSSLKSDLAKAVNERKDLENTIQSEKKDSSYWESKASEFDTDLQAERKKLERMRITHDKDNKNKEAELATLKGKLKVLEQSSGAGAKRISDLKQEYEETVKKLEHSLAVEKAEYEELTGKYEMLEEEHVVTKARLTVEKEQAQSELIHLQKELSSTLTELKTMQENYEKQSAAWTKEKSELQIEISSLQERLCGGGWEVERARLQARLDQRERELRTAQENRDVLTHQQDATKKELEEAKQMLEDYERVSKIQRNLTTENAELEQELTNLQARLEQAEKARKAEITDTKMRYDGQMNTMRDELKSLQNQVSRFKRERDNYKQMLDAAQKSINEIKNGDKNARAKRTSISSTDEEEYRTKLATLEQQVACLEDELCDSRLNASKLNTELISEKSSAEVRLAEMQSKLNEYEEERLLSSGRARIAGLATRMELAWHKERDEQQRLLQETSTLARDLRQTLFEVERERDKERLDMKRRIDQLKRTTEEETEEAKKKVTELQCDLLELRDAHAKLRTANEKLRRDKERHDRDRDQNKLLVASLKRAQQEDDKTITQLLETIDDLMKQSPNLFKEPIPVKPEKNLMTPTPPRRNRSSKSRSRSATPESVEATSAEAAAATAARLRRLTDELRASRIAERTRRQQASQRRAMSTEPRDTLSVTPSSRTPSRAPSLKKRSISLEQTTKDQSVIWKTVDDSSVSSMQSLDGDGDGRLFTMQRDASLDSRLSGGSAQSDILPTEKKKKKSIFGKLKKLTKSRSIDDQADPEVVEFKPIGTVSQGSDSDMSAAGGSKRDLRGRLSDMFSRKGQLSRGNSKELDDTGPERPASALGVSTRPILRNASSNTLQRASPAKPNDAQSLRGSSMTPAVKRKGK